MLTPYRDVLAQPGALRFSLAGLLARLPISMLTLGVVLLVSGTGRSYALAGTAAGAVNLGFVFAGPRLGRLVDRYGQATVLRPAALAQATAVTGLIVAGTQHAPGPVLVALGLLTGMSMPSIGGLVRARWSALLDSPDRLHTAYSFESVLDEVIFILGPLIATVLAVSVHPAAGLAAVLAVGPTGALALAAARGTEPVVAPHDPGPGAHPALLSPGLVVVVGVFVGLGALFGAVEVATVAFTSAEDARGAAGFVLAVYALGSLTAGLLFGALRREAPARQWFLAGALGIGVSALALPHAESVAGLTVLILVSGVAISPTLISGLTLVRELAPPARLTEALAWATTALTVGLMLGSAAAGWLSEHAGPADGFWAATAGALTAAALAAAGAAWLRPAPAAVSMQLQNECP